MPKNVGLAVGIAVVLAVLCWTFGASTARAVSCGPKPPIPPGSCIVDYRCSADGSWEDVYAAIGTACNDGNACTYNDVCVNSYGTCQGTSIICTRPCEVCSGTATCALRAAGTACPVSTDNPCEAVCDGVSPYCQPR